MTGPGDLFTEALDLHRAGEWAAAARTYRRVLAMDSAHIGALGNLGGLLFAEGGEAEGLAMLERAAALARRQQAVAQFNLGHALVAADRLEEAVSALRLAAGADPDSAETQSLLGAALDRLGHGEEALDCHRAAMTLAPRSETARFNLGVALLRRGAFAEGWRHYHARLRSDAPTIRIGERRLPCPEWGGSPLAGRTILVHGEQGLGDHLQFVRFLRDLKEQGARVVLACPGPLARLFAELPWIDALLAPPAGEERLDLSGVRADCHAPLLSLPYRLGLDRVPALAAPYLHAAPARAASAGTASAGTGLKVGLVWRGNPDHPDDRNRSLAPDRLAPLLRRPGVAFFSLQKDATAEELAGLGGPVTDLGGGLDDLTDAAARIAQLDLLITVDTAMAHLAGAMGKPVWILLSFLTDWRWLAEGDTTPWYPSARLFRQQRPQDWTGALAQVRRALAAAPATAPPRTATTERRAPRVLLVGLSKHRCGVGVWTHALALGLRRHGFEVVVARTPEPSSAPSAAVMGVERRAGVRHLAFDYDPDSAPERFAGDGAQARRLLDAAAPSLVVLINGANPWLCFAASAEAEALAIPVVISDHLVHRALLPGGKAENAPLRRRYLAARAALLVSDDNAAALRAALALPPGFGTVIPNGCPDRFFAPVDAARRRALRRRFGIPDDAVVALTVAKLEAVKGHAAQLPAFVQAMGRTGGHPPLHAVWLGDGPLRGRLDDAVLSAGLGGHVHLAGHCDDVTPWLDMADLVLLTSHAEGMPLSVIEAMAKGLPVVASAVGGVAEALGGTGILLPPPSDATLTPRLTEALITLAADPALRRRLGAQARARAEARFREDRMVGECVAAIEAALSRA